MTLYITHYYWTILTLKVIVCSAHTANGQAGVPLSTLPAVLHHRVNVDPLIVGLISIVPLSLALAAT